MAKHDKNENEHGHTYYPKWVDTPEKDAKGKPIRKLVKDEAEEAEVIGSKKKPASWDK